MNNFKAVVVREEDDQVKSRLEEVEMEQLSEGDLIIEVEYSTMNYKDMLAFQKEGGVLQDYPMIPGIDFAGVVVSSEDSDFNEGDRVIGNGTDVGVKKTGGYAKYVRVTSEDIVLAPEGLSSQDAMTYGTAGFTAALSIEALENQGMSVDNNPNILVTGSTGGVGSVALRILSKLGYENLYALVRKDYQVEIAKKLGAKHIVYAEELDKASATLASRKYHYVLDTVGGDVAVKSLAQIYEEGSMSMCGNAGGHQFNATVLPMILRGVNILGINSVGQPKKKRKKLWNKLATEWNVANQLVVNEINLESLTETIGALKEGKHIGRTIVKIK